jgi:hypothetical protein
MGCGIQAGLAMTNQDLQEIKKVIGDMRFMQAAALVASGTSEDKSAIAYMKNLARLERAVDAEILK